MTAKDFLQYWLKTAADDWDTADKLIEDQKYHHSLFFCHLALEKLLKGIVFINTNSHALPVHNLVRLAKQAGLSLSEIQSNDFKEITSWNIEARYDSYKFTFYKKATREYTHKWFKKAKEIYIWLQNQY